MKPHRLLTLLACAFVALLFALLIAFNHTKPRLLVLHSFAENGPWKMRFDRGAQRALADNRQPLSMRWHYMNFADADVLSDAEWEAASARARAEIDTWRPDVVLIVGEEAQQWVGRAYAHKPPRNLRLVYATSEDPVRFGYSGSANVTGVRERLPLTQVAQVLAQLEPHPLRIQALGLADPTGEAEADQVRAFDWQNHQLLPVRLVRDYGGWQQAVREAGDQADVLLVLSYAGMRRSAAEPAVVTTPEVSGWTARHARPLALSVREGYVAGGGALAIAPSAEALGEQAARLALQALPGQSLPAPQQTEDFVIGLRPQQLAERGYHLPDIYVQAARAARLLFTDP